MTKVQILALTLASWATLNQLLQHLWDACFQLWNANKKSTCLLGLLGAVKVKRGVSREQHALRKPQLPCLLSPFTLFFQDLTPTETLVTSGTYHQYLSFGLLCFCLHFSPISFAYSIQWLLSFSLRDRVFMTLKPRDIKIVFRFTLGTALPPGVSRETQQSWRRGLFCFIRNQMVRPIPISHTF